jgi:hypothetical protein
MQTWAPQDDFSWMLREKVGPVLRRAGVSGFFAHMASAVVRRGLCRRVSAEVAVELKLPGDVLRQRRGLTDGVVAVQPGVLPDRAVAPVGEQRPGSAAGTSHPKNFPYGDWQLTDEEDSRQCAALLRTQLETVTIPELTALPDREALLEFVGDGAPGWTVVPGSDLACAFVVADEGFTPRLESLLDRAERSRRVPSAAEANGPRGYGASPPTRAHTRKDSAHRTHGPAHTGGLTPGEHATIMPMCGRHCAQTGLKPVSAPVGRVRDACVGGSS